MNEDLQSLIVLVVILVTLYLLVTEIIEKVMRYRWWKGRRK